jgi:hypothetical protein
MIDITRVQKALDNAGYLGVASNESSVYAVVSPYTRRPIVVPLATGSRLPETAVRHLLQGEPDIDGLVSQMWT